MLIKQGWPRIWWIIPIARIKTRNKNPFNQRVFLTPLAKSLLPDVSGELFFPSPDKKGESSIRENTLSQLFSRKKQKYNGVVIRPYLELPKWWPHDLRRSLQAILFLRIFKRESNQVCVTVVVFNDHYQRCSWVICQHGIFPICY